ncbi:hypothetical protein ACFFRR_000445 [Megaselia abdita]
MPLKAFQERLSFYIANVNVSGVKYLNHKNANNLGRLFWLIMLIISGSGMVFILKLTFQRYYSDMITIDVDTLFLHWDNTFPAVSICLMKGRSSPKIRDYIKAAKVPYTGPEISYVRLIHSYMFMTTVNTEFSMKNECAGLNETCGVNIDVLRNVLFVHTPEEEPYPLLPTAQSPLQDSIRMLYGIEEIINEDDVHFVPPHTRGCRFPNEPISSNLRNYSFSNCMNELSALEEIKICNCTTDLRFVQQSRECQLTDKDCLSSNKLFEIIRERQSNTPSLCLPSCVEMRIQKIGNYQKPYGDDIIRVGVEILQPPFIRYRRRLSSNIMDLVVCVGGIAGLFYGASVVNIVEFVYIWAVRRF